MGLLQKLIQTIKLTVIIPQHKGEHSNMVNNIGSLYSPEYWPEWPVFGQKWALLALFFIFLQNTQ